MIRWLLWILAGALLGGLVHLMTVLILPRLATPGRLLAAVTRGARQLVRCPAGTDRAECGHAVHGSGVCRGGLPL